MKNTLSLGIRWTKVNRERFCFKKLNVVVYFFYEATVNRLFDFVCNVWTER